MLAATLVDHQCKTRYYHSHSTISIQPTILPSPSPIQFSIYVT